MQGLSAARILEAWERGQGRSSTECALALLAAGLPDTRPADLASLSLGQRDLLLLRLRELTLGPELKGYTDCPRCGVTIDFKLLVDDLWNAGAVAAPSGLPAAGGGAGAGAASETFRAPGGYEIEFRLPNSRDIAAAAACAGVDEARALLLSRTIHSVTREGDAVLAADLPAGAVAALAEHIENRDPQAETPLALSCGRCHHQWQPLLDIAAFLWGEVSALAERLLIDIQTLARYYGWSESEILSMSAARRDFYLQHATNR